MITMDLREQYLQQGFLSPVDILDENEAAEHRRRLEAAEDEIGNYGDEKIADSDLDPAALAWRDQIEKIHRGITATD